jgi:two-component system nitrogen regulation response regulator NtrX
MQTFAAEDNLRPRSFTAEAIQRLSSYGWNGNVRELRNTIERLLIMAPGETIGVSDLPETIRYGEETPAEGEGTSTLKEFKETSERAFLVSKLRENGWNISQTASVIGTPRSNLYKKLEQYKISQERDG